VEDRADFCDRAIFDPLSSILAFTGPQTRPPGQATEHFEPPRQILCTPGARCLSGCSGACPDAGSRSGALARWSLLTVASPAVYQSFAGQLDLAGIQTIAVKPSPMHLWELPCGVHEDRWA
jgi:hypothetical protein